MTSSPTGSRALEWISGFFLAILLAALFVQLATPRSVDAAATSGKCSGGVFAGNSLKVSTGRGTITYNARFFNFWSDWFRPWEGSATGRLRDVRNLRPDRTLQTKSVSWEDGEVYVSGSISYKSAGFKKGQTVTLRVQVTKPNTSNSWAETCSVKVTLA